MRGREGEGPGWKRDRGGVKGGRIRYGGRQERSPEGQENEFFYGGIEEPLESPRILEYVIPRLNGDAIG